MRLLVFVLFLAGCSSVPQHTSYVEFDHLGQAGRHTHWGDYGSPSWGAVSRVPVVKRPEPLKIKLARALYRVREAWAQAQFDELMGLSLEARLALEAEQIVTGRVLGHLSVEPMGWHPYQSVVSRVVVEEVFDGGASVGDVILARSLLKEGADASVLVGASMVIMLVFCDDWYLVDGLRSGSLDRETLLDSIQGREAAPLAHLRRVAMGLYRNDDKCR